MDAIINEDIKKANLFVEFLGILNLFKRRDGNLKYRYLLESMLKYLIKVQS